MTKCWTYLNIACERSWEPGLWLSKAEVGAITARQGVDLLGRDAETKVIVLVSKPPDPDVATILLATAQASGKPVVVNFIGYSAPARQLGNLHFANALSEAAEMAVELAEAGETVVASDSKVAAGEGQRYLRGLFSGGTLAYEALRGLQVALTPIYSNVPIHPSQKLEDPLTSQGHTVLDLGEDIFTVGRLHPMMDNDLRLRRLKLEAANPEVAMILLDVVLGEGAHHDPASELAPAIAEASEKYRVAFVVVLVGTDEDPQDIEAQRKALVEAGAKVFEDTVEAVSYISSKLGSCMAEKVVPVALEGLTAPLAAINVGIETFYDSLMAQDAKTVHVEWRPPAGGDEKLMSILAKMR